MFALSVTATGVAGRWKGWSRQALGRCRHLLRGDPEVERVACERLGLEPAPSSTQVLQRDRHAEVLNALALLAASLERFALEIRHLARTEVREVEEPFGERQKGSSAMPHKRNPIVSERICGLARVVRAGAVVGLENVALWHERDISHSSAERIVLPDAFLAVDYMLDRFAWLLKDSSSGPSACARTSTRAIGCTSASDCCSHSSRPASRATTLPARATPRDARLGRGLDFPELVRADAEIAGRVDLDAVFDLGAYTRHVDVVSTGFARSAGSRSMPEAAIHLGSGKVRELYALDDERLLLVASDRISVFDVILPTEVPDKGRVLTGLSAFWFARTQGIVPNHLLALRNDGRSLECRRLEMLPGRVVVRGYLSGSGWKDYPRTGAVCGHQLPPGLRESDRLPEPIVTPATKAQSGHDENIDGRRRRPGRRRALGRSGVGRARALPLRGRIRRGARNHPRRHEVRARGRPTTARSCSETRH